MVCIGSSGRGIESLKLGMIVSSPVQGLAVGIAFDQKVIYQQVDAKQPRHPLSPTLSRCSCFAG